jgi:KilA-N domain
MPRRSMFLRREGRYSLNDLHRAAGGAKHHQPALFLRNDQTKALIAEIHSTKSQSAVKTINGGPAHVSYSVKELVYAYANWISPGPGDAIITARRLFPMGTVRGGLPSL